MSREILFRGRTVSESEYLDDGEWIEGFYTCFNGDEHRIYTGYAETDCGDYYPDWFNVIPETVGRFTGLTDKNGKRVFEGDIIYMGLFPYVVKYDVENARYMLFTSRGSKRDGFNAFTMETHEVIGNIHDDPELLK